MKDLEQYLIDRKLFDSDYYRCVKAEDLNKRQYKLFSVDGQDYMLSHFFDDSNELGYSLIKTNCILQTDNSNMVAIAAVQGDDVICINISDNSIWLWCIQSANGNYAKIADSFNLFKQIALK